MRITGKDRNRQNAVEVLYFAITENFILVTCNTDDFKNNTVLELFFAARYIAG
jgi:hypothetical protein